MRRILLALLVPLSVCAQERITSYVSDVTINNDGTLYVKETIAVRALGHDIKRGIVREFPTTYHDYAGARSYVVDFNLQKVLLDGRPVAHRLSREDNGVRIYVGDAHTYLAPGNYTYTIEYTTNRQLGFFETHDELYWNVTGCGWRLPIDFAKAIIHAPQGAKILGVEAATGYQDEAGKHFTISNHDDYAVIKTTRALPRYAGLTVTVAWPKGVVAEPTMWQTLWWFIKDNLLILLIGLILFLCFFFVLYCLYIQDKINASGVIIPQFYPPNDMAPSTVGTLDNLGFDHKFIAADIVYLAVKGLIKITHKDSGAYTLSLVEDADIDSKLTLYERKLKVCLFSNQSSIDVGKGYSSAIERLAKLVQNSAKSAVRDTIIESYFMSGIFGYAILSIIGLSIITLLCCVAIMPELFVLFGFILLFFGGGTTWIASALKVYSQQGRRIQDHVDGFKLFLSTTEIDRMNMVGTPPTKTPELYEKYLPYAMALGLERQWSDQFAPIFAQLELQGHPYRPCWYVGSRPFRTSSFSPIASGLGRSMSSAISSSSVRPGSSSGMSGGGFGGGGGTRSGGGGGGGGGGGW